MFIANFSYATRSALRLRLVIVPVTTVSTDEDALRSRISPAVGARSVDLSDRKFATELTSSRIGRLCQLSAPLHCLPYTAAQLTRTALGLRQVLAAFE